MISILLKVIWNMPLHKIIVVCIIDDFILLVRLWPFYLGVLFVILIRKLYYVIQTKIRMKKSWMYDISQMIRSSTLIFKKRGKNDKNNHF